MKGGNRGKKRREGEVSLCFAPRLCWVVQWWKSEHKQLALVVDATTLAERWTILAISVVWSRVCDPSGLESAAWQGRRLLASALGRTAEATGRRGGRRLAGAGPGRSRVICALVMGCGPGLWLASVLA